MLADYKDSKEAARMAGVTLAHLHKWLERHPEYKPAHRFGKSFLWTEQEIERVIVARSQPDPADE